MHTYLPPRPSSAEGQMSPKRKRRLDKINAAKTDLESALLTLREHFGISWTDKCFQNLYYLNRLARKAP